jgi:uncharacterized protein
VASDAPRERTLPIFALGTVLVPGAPLPLHIFEQRYRQMAADLLASETPEFVVLLIKQGDEVLETPFPGLTGQPPVTFEVGTVARIDESQCLADGRYRLLCSGQTRVRLVERTQEQPYPMGRFTLLDGTVPERYAPDVELTADRVRQAIRRVFEAVLKALPPEKRDQRAEIRRVIDVLPEDAQTLSYFVVRVLFTASLQEKQKLLEAADAHERLQLALPLVLLEERLAGQSLEGGADAASRN